MHTIFKYPLETTDRQIIRAPKFAEPLCVQIQNDIPCLWLLVGTANPARDYTIYIHGTGHEVSDHLEKRYIGSYQLLGGSFVGHVFMMEPELTIKERPC